MCGIAGIWHRDGRPVERTSLESMVATLVHRGPDGLGLHIDGGLALGHRRLKIIDLSEAAAQPIWLPDRSIGMVYNGEIHNYLELAQELRQLGAPLRADNDTEVLLWAYRHWGEACFPRLNGMWAAAFWHPAERRLLLSRDRFGIKPLVYSVHGTRVAFASEPKALLAAYPEERRPDLALVHDFVVGAVSDADEHTFFENIRSVPAGHMLRIAPGREQLLRHWDFQPGTEAERPDAPEAFIALLRDAVRLRLRSDVPVGLLLSGGLDSSALARLAVGEMSQALQCISLRYDSPALDESDYVRAVADDPARYDVHWVTPSADALLETIGAIVWHHDAPTPLRGRYPQWHVLREASRHATVVLGGQGSDELLAGYDRFLLPFARDRLDPRLPGARSRWLLPLDLYRLGQVSTGIHRVLPQLLSERARRRVAPWVRRRAPTRFPLARDGAIGERAAQPHRFIGTWRQPVEDRPYRSRLNNALWAELHHAGLPELLHSEDALSMAFSLESRLPFLDHRVVEFCFSLPYSEKVGSGWTKWLLRRATAGVLPETVRWRRHKKGFPGDYAGWLSTAQGLDAVRQLLLDPITVQRGWFESRWLRSRLGGARSDASQWVRRHFYQIWHVVTIELWCRQFLDGDRPLRPSAAAGASGAAGTGADWRRPAATSDPAFAGAAGFRS